MVVARRWEGTAAAAAAAPAAVSSNPKITQIVDQIAQLNLLETADLVASLKVGCDCSLLFGGGVFSVLRCCHIFFFFFVFRSLIS